MDTLNHDLRHTPATLFVAAVRASKVVREHAPAVPKIGHVPYPRLPAFPRWVERP
jgi:hypothetical protein